MKSVAKVFSVVFHPVFILLYSFCFYFEIDNHHNYLNKNLNLYVSLLIFVFIMGVVFPIISMLIMYRSKTISSLSIPNRKERIPMLFLVIIYYSMIYYIFWNWNNQLSGSFELYLSFLFGGILTLLISTIITLKWKISLHSIAISGFSGGMLGILLESIGNWAYIYNLETMMIYNTILILLIGIVSYSRLVLNAHTYSQVLVGIILGFTIELTCVLNHLHI